MRFAIAAAALLIGAPGFASDINKGYTFTVGEQNVTHTKLNNLVDGATINTSFFTDKSALTTLNSADTFLLYSPTLSGYRKTTLQTLLLGNTSLITGQTEDPTPADNDYVLTYDTSAAVFAKVSLLSLARPNTNLIYLLPTLESNLLQSAYVPVLQDGTNNKAPLNLLLGGWQLYAFTNLAPINLQTNDDELLIWDASAGTNKTISIAGWNTNPPIASTFTNDDSFLFWSSATNAADGTNGRLKRVTITGLYTNPPTTTLWTNTDTLTIWSTATNGPGGTNPTPAKVALGTLLPQNFVSTNYALPTVDGGGITNIAHGLPGTPQRVRWVATCAIANAGYAVGDEVDASRFADSGGQLPAWGFGANATNVWISFTRRGKINRKDGTSNYDAITEADWRVKCYATWSPY